METLIVFSRHYFIFRMTIIKNLGLSLNWTTEGQLISERNFGVFNLPKKRTKHYLWSPTCEISGFCLLLFPQNERTQLSQFVYFLRKVCLFFNFLNNKTHNYDKQNIIVNFIIQKFIPWATVSVTFFYFN